MISNLNLQLPEPRSADALVGSERAWFSQPQTKLELFTAIILDDVWCRLSLV